MNVYTECLQTGGGSEPTSPGRRTGTGNSHAVPPTVTSRTAKALKRAGKDSDVLFALVNRYVPPRLLAKSAQPARAAASSLRSAFDLGAGPTALLIVLAGTPLLLLGGSGFQKWRQQRHT